MTIRLIAAALLIGVGPALVVASFPAAADPTPPLRVNADLHCEEEFHGLLHVTLAIRPGEGRVYWREDDGKTYVADIIASEAFVNPYSAPVNEFGHVVGPPAEVSIRFVTWAGGGLFAGNVGAAPYNLQTDHDGVRALYGCLPGSGRSAPVDTAGAIRVVPTVPTENNDIMGAVRKDCEAARRRIYRTQEEANVARRSCSDQ